MSHYRAPEVPSPCVRNCCLDDDDICLGCFRSLQEITAWAEATDEQKREILSRANGRRFTRNNDWGG